MWVGVLRYIGLGVAGFVVTVGGTALAADNKVDITISPEATAIFNSSTNTLTAGLQGQFGDLAKEGATHVKLFGKTPIQGNQDTPLVQFDRLVSNWRIGGGLGYEADLTGQTGPAMYGQITSTFEWGNDRFTYNPGGGTDQHATRRSSWAAEIDALAGFLTPKDGQFIPQVLTRYDRSFKADKTVGVERGTTTDGKILTQNVVINPPTARPLTTVQGFVPFYLSTHLPVAFGPSIAYAWLGNKNDEVGGEVQRIRSELWVYYFPVQAANEFAATTKIANVRIGLAPFWDARTKGTDDRSANEYGVLVQLRLGVNLKDY